MEVKISKEELNSLMDNVSHDNVVYGLIFKLCYVYGKRISEVLSLNYTDIDLNNMKILFKNNTKTTQYPLIKEIYKSLKYIITNECNGKIFIKDDINMSSMVKRLNYHLGKTSYSLFKCRLTVSDLRKLRGQHLIIDGVPLAVVDDFYESSNLRITKNLIDYDNLIQSMFPCKNVDDIFMDYTDLSLFTDEYKLPSLYYVMDEGGEWVLFEYDTDEGNINWVDSTSDELMDKLTEMSLSQSWFILDSIPVGDYKIFRNLKFYCGG